MLRLSTKSKMSPEEVIRKAVKIFGPAGYHLEVKEQGNCSVTFEGGGGGVEVTAATEGKKTSVEMTSREWDYQVRQFMEKIG